MAALAPLLARVLAQFPDARQEPLTDHPLAVLVRGAVAGAVAERAGGSYRVVGSPGQGNWAETPWVSVFDPMVTESAQRGYYVVYLFRGDGTGVYLSLNQATTEVRRRVGADYLEVLADTATAYAGLLRREGVDDLEDGPIDLGARTGLSRGYQAGNVLARFYPAGALPEDAALEEDLGRLLTLYGVLVEALDELRQGTDPDPETPDVQPGLEAQRYRWHRRAERNRKLAKAAKRAHGETCTVCGFNFGERYGELGRGYIEAHHLVPLEELKGRPTELDPQTDFTVVCANCHRMLHRRRTGTLSIEALSAAVVR